jgi:uncharacterized protein with FMN-binding domain
MKKIVYAVLATISGLVLLFSYRTSLGESVTAPSPADPGTTTGSSAPATGSSGSSSSTGSSSSGSADAATGSTSTTGLSDGTFTGQAASTRFGPVQVAITVSGGTITDVSVPEYPNNDRRDQEINSRALPQLVSETLSAQSADIDMVSGATYTSRGYEQSLQSAIDQASS